MMINICCLHFLFAIVMFVELNIICLPPLDSRGVSFKHFQFEYGIIYQLQREFLLSLMTWNQTRA